jgi:hypothetical protein
MRIEINLTTEVAAIMKEKAQKLNHSRKSYIELLCINDSVATKPIKKRKPKSTK